MPERDERLPRKLAAEAVGTAFLLTTIVGSGIMGDRLAAGNFALALLANSVATGCSLVALILALGPISGAHLNPVVSLASAVQGELSWREAPAYIGAQVLGAVVGVALAHGMFELRAFSASGHVRAGGAQVLSEAVASFGLVLVILGCARQRPGALPFAVAGYITAAYWFTSSTSFANPAVTVARSLTDTFSGIRPKDVPGFLLGQSLGATAAVLLYRWLVSARRPAPNGLSPSRSSEEAPRG